MQITGSSSLFAPPPTQGATSGATGLAGDLGTPSAEAEFLDYARMSPAQRLRASILDALGVSEDDLRAMEPKERKAMEQKIQEMIKAKIEGDPQARPGSLLDVQA